MISQCLLAMVTKWSFHVQQLSICQTLMINSEGLMPLVGFPNASNWLSTWTLGEILWSDYKIYPSMIQAGILNCFDDKSHCFWEVGSSEHRRGWNVWWFERLKVGMDFHCQFRLGRIAWKISPPPPEAKGIVKRGGAFWFVAPHLWNTLWEDWRTAPSGA